MLVDVSKQDQAGIPTMHQRAAHLVFFHLCALTFGGTLLIKHIAPQGLQVLFRLQARRQFAPSWLRTAGMLCFRSHRTCARTLLMTW
jgi:hypothetical protein